ncbi:MAG: glutaredoxin family protein [Actinobacteria bacterium]|nr:glutaredoxin family protein [Actinomycetota bacterium]
MTDLGAVVVYGAEWCGDCRRSKAQLERLGVEFVYRDVAANDADKDEAIAISGRQSIPVIVLPDGSHLVEPSNPQLESELRRLSLID